MRAVLFTSALVSVLAMPTLALLSPACDDTPRGEQGIDFLSDGGYYVVPSGPDAGADVFVPCVEEMDPSGICAAAIASNGTPATHRIVCTPGSSPLQIVCVTPDASVPDAGEFCCTTGLL